MSSVTTFRVRRFIAVNTGITMKRIPKAGPGVGSVLDLVAKIGYWGDDRYRHKA